MRKIASAFATLLLLGCQNGNTSPGAQPGPSETIRAHFLEEFSLRVDQSADLASPPASLSLLAVEGDSRCPVDVQCVWQGDVSVIVDLRVPGLDVRRDTLHSSGRDGDQRSMTLGNVKLTLRAVAPDPHSGQSIPAKDYRATFMADRVGD